MRSPRFDAATRDLGEIYAQGGWVCAGDIEKIASRHSDTAEERADLVGYLSTLTNENSQRRQPTVAAP